MSAANFPEKLIIRQAGKHDIPAMMNLIRELAKYEKAPNEVTVSEEVFSDAGFGAHPVWWAYIAEIDKQVVGFALYHIRYSTWKGPMMYLEDIIVTEDWRGKGIGKLLFEQLIITAKEKNLKGLFFQALDWNEDAINFYKKYKGVQFDDSWVNCTLHF
ncbi:MAG: GNAT family N-acetyltransferase [Chitinophagaceae bacterium]|nr:GNAT family N-acetyltransferase [Chitinophagaceae bacterium]